MVNYGNINCLGIVFLYLPYLSSVYIFQDLLNFDDPLNVEAADHYERDKVNTLHKWVSESE